MKSLCLTCCYDKKNPGYSASYCSKAIKLDPSSVDVPTDKLQPDQILRNLGEFKEINGEQICIECNQYKPHKGKVRASTEKKVTGSLFHYVEHEKSFLLELWAKQSNNKLSVWFNENEVFVIQVFEDGKMEEHTISDPQEIYTLLNWIVGEK